MTTEEMMTVMEASTRGEAIQYKLKSEDEWTDNPCPAWNWALFDYRVKSRDKYRPYADKDECMKDMIKHGGWVKTKESGCYWSPVHVNHDVEYIVPMGTFDESFAEFYENNIWADDGSPCGVKI